MRNATWSITVQISTTLSTRDGPTGRKGGLISCATVAGAGEAPKRVFRPTLER